MQSMTIDAAAIRLTETILGDDGPDLEQTLKAIATNIGVLHISYAPLCSQKSEDANLFSAICTYPVAWQARYFKKQYARIDPVLARGREAVLPFDWNEWHCQLVGSRTRKTIVPRDLMQPRRPLAMRSSPQRGRLGRSVVLLDDAGR